jgi:putative inorganic carbon (HCO3(-)) transporter
MAFCLTAAYVSLTFLSVTDTFPALAPYRIQLIVGILAILATLPTVVSSWNVLFNKQSGLMAGFTSLVLLSWLPHGWFGGALISLQQFMPLGLAFFLIAFNVRSINDLRTLRLCLLAVTLYLVGRGLSDYFWNPENSNFVMIQSEFGVTISRLQALGILADPNAFAQFLLAMLPLLFVEAKSRSWLTRNVVLSGIGGVLLAGIYFTHSRGALVGLALLIGVLARERIKLVGATLAAVMATVVLVAAGFSGYRPVSISGGTDRLDIWSDGLGLLKSSPILGIGFNGFMEQLVYTAHNSFLLCVVEIGLIGYFFWMGLLLVSFWQLRLVASPVSADDSDPELRAWANAVLFSLIGFLLPGFFLSETYAPMLYVLLGMSGAISRLEIERTGAELLPAGNHWARKTSIACAASIALIYVMVRMRAV